MTLLALDPGVEKSLELNPGAIEAVVRTHEVARHLVDEHLGDALLDLAPLRTQLLPEHVAREADLKTGMGLCEGDGLILEVVFDVIKGHPFVVCLCGYLGDTASLLWGWAKYFGRIQ